MKKKVGRIFLGIVLIPTMVLACIYIGMGIYYQNCFSFGTWINEIYATGLGVSEMNTRLLAQEDPYQLQIRAEDGTVIIMDGKDISYQKDYSEQLSQIQIEQNPLLWGYHYLYPMQYKLKPVYSFDKEAAIKQIQDLPWYEDQAGKSNPRVEILRTTEGYVLIDETAHTVDTEKFVRLILKALEDGSDKLDLKTQDYYKEYQMSTQMKETVQLFDKINEIQSTKIVYQNETTEYTLSSSDIAECITVDKTGKVQLDRLQNVTLQQDKIEKLVERIADKFDTVGKKRIWNKSSGGVVEIDSGTFGFKVDKIAEAKRLTSHLTRHIAFTDKPCCAENVLDNGTGDIGDTYIEVDMSQQMLYYYVNGRLDLSSDVVTGCTARRRGTPEKVCYVYAKQRNRTLRGANYAAFVKYWMPVYGNIGLHDANWRDEFGGEIYKKSGSHGCINMPSDKAKRLYDEVEIGTPVIMYY